MIPAERFVFWQSPTHGHQIIGLVTREIPPTLYRKGRIEFVQLNGRAVGKHYTRSSSTVTPIKPIPCLDEYIHDHLSGLNVARDWLKEPRSIRLLFQASEEIKSLAEKVKSAIEPADETRLWEFVIRSAGQLYEKSGASIVCETNLMTHQTGLRDLISRAIAPTQAGIKLNEALWRLKVQAA